MKIEIKQRIIGGLILIIAVITLLPFFILENKHNKNDNATASQAIMFTDANGTTTEIPSDSTDSNTDNAVINNSANTENTDQNVASYSDSNEALSTNNTSNASSVSNNDANVVTTSEDNSNVGNAASDNAQGISDSGGSNPATNSAPSNINTQQDMSAPSEQNSPLPMGSEDIASNKESIPTSTSHVSMTSNINPTPAVPSSEMASLRDTHHANITRTVSASSLQGQSASLTNASTENNVNLNAANNFKDTASIKPQTLAVNTNNTAVNSINAKKTIVIENKQQPIAMATQAAVKTSAPKPAQFLNSANSYQPSSSNLPAAGSGQWVIQLASFSQASNAQRMLQQLKAQGLPAFSESGSMSSGGAMVRIFAGPFTEARAIEVKQMLHSDGIIKKWYQ